MINLDTKPRTKGEKLVKIRKDGSIPAVFYSKKEPTTSISLNEIDFMKAWKAAG